ncbi:MAG: YdeI/OmpD-associated family protein [Dehalococcoidia bacterium]|jgi:uncharacterized protein YdeI (YjbR/CyaY-like superfamily)|nr:YdeI/OmpD-associated family protein [Dehalococcoidia bacterium]
MSQSRRVDSLERVHVATRGQLHDWLATNHLTSPGMWLVTFRKETGKPRPGFDDIVEELISFGWIDSKLIKLDETQTMLLCTPRSPTSEWSKTNRERVRKLAELGLMQPRGLEMVDIARHTGTWDSLDEIDNLAEPEDLAASLDACENARANWSASAASYRRGVLYWIRSAKRPGTRLNRIQTAVAAAAANRRIGGPPRSEQATDVQTHCEPGTPSAAADALTTREARLEPRRSRPSSERGRDA